MYQSKYEWLLRTANAEIDSDLIDQFNISEFEQTILENRNITTEEELNAVYRPLTHQSALLSNIEEAKRILNEAKDNQERVLVYGDFDADGITSTFLLVRALSTYSYNVDYYIPNRLNEGYGPNDLFFKENVINNYDLVICVDNGIAAIDEIELLKQNDIKVIIIDHHQIPNDVPNAVIIHPELNHSYPFKHLCGVGAVYKFIEYLDMTHDDDLAYVAIGTVADLVPLKDENKYFVIEGLKVLNNHPPSAIKSLLNAAGHSGIIDEETIGFTIAPRLNATGRMDDANIAVELLLSEDVDLMYDISMEIESLNNTRKDIVKEIFRDAKNLVNEDDEVIIVYNENWHHGILGIVASKLVEFYGKPAIVLSKNNDYYKGSGRSIDGLDLLSMMQPHLDIIKTLGGHSAAFGIELEENKIPKLKDLLNEDIKKQQVLLKPIKYIDYKMNKNLSIKSIDTFMRLKPFGYSFTAPIFLLSQVKIATIKQVGKDKAHIKMSIVDYDIDVIGWNFGHLIHEMAPNDEVSLIGTINVNEFNNKRRLQLNLMDVSIEAVQIIDMRSKLNQRFEQISSDDIFLVNESIDVDKPNYFKYGETLPLINDTVVLRDLPNNINHLKQSLHQIHLSKVILIFNQKEELYFNGLPKKETFEQVLNIIKSAKDESIDLKIHAHPLSKKVATSLIDLKRIIDVLIDLEHIELNNGIVKKKNIEESLNLEQSIYYKILKGRLESEKHLKIVSTEEVKSLIRNYLTNEG